MGAWKPLIVPAASSPPWVGIHPQGRCETTHEGRDVDLQSLRNLSRIWKERQQIKSQWLFLSSYNSPCQNTGGLSLGKRAFAILISDKISSRDLKLAWDLQETWIPVSDKVFLVSMYLVSPNSKSFQMQKSLFSTDTTEKPNTALNNKILSCMISRKCFFSPSQSAFMCNICLMTGRSKLQSSEAIENLLVEKDTKAQRLAQDCTLIRQRSWLDPRPSAE